jgi:hypothetical protein
VSLLQNVSKLSANLLQNTVPKNVGLKNVGLKNVGLQNVGLPKLHRNVVFQKIVSSNTRF